MSCVMSVEVSGGFIGQEDNPTEPTYQLLKCDVCQ